MAIYHDAWLFAPDVFAESISEFVVATAENPSEGYVRLRAATVTALERGDAGLFFADRYGGWDGESLLSEKPETFDGDLDSIAFFLTIHLYLHLAECNPERDSFGLGELWRDESIGMDSRDWDHLIKGYNFGAFAERYLLSPRSPTEFREHWARVRPLSTGGRMGWLDSDEVASLSRRLSDGFADDLRPASQSTVQTVASNAILRAETMLRTAAEHQRGICLILSG